MKQRTIFFFWLPLAFSWLLMTVEGPWVQGVISRKANAETQLAAFGLVMSLAITIEAPIIMMLATSNALCKDRQSYRNLWRYMMIVNFILTIIHILMAFTPLLDWWFEILLNVPSHIIDATRPAMAIMLSWSAFIGYRRFHQGILITYSHTRIVGQGTIVRIVISASIALILGFLTDLSGAVIGAFSVIFAVFGEMLYIYWQTRPDIEDLLTKDRSPNLAPVSYPVILRFHLPLAFTSLLTLLVRPMIEKGLASTQNAESALAAWAVVFTILLVTRSGGLSWQEVVLTLGKGEAELRALRRFTLTLGLATSGFLALVAWTPLMGLYTGPLLSVPVNIRPLIVTGSQVAFSIPLLTTLQSYLRAVMMRSENTNPIYQGMLVNLITTVACMWIGLDQGISGIFMASLALTLGSVVETLFLYYFYQDSKKRLAQTWQMENTLFLSQQPTSNR